MELCGDNLQRHFDRTPEFRGRAVLPMCVGTLDALRQLDRKWIHRDIKPVGPLSHVFFSRFALPGLSGYGQRV